MPEVCIEVLKATMKVEMGDTVGLLIGVLDQLPPLAFIDDMYIGKIDGDPEDYGKLIIKWRVG